MAKRRDCAEKNYAQKDAEDKEGMAQKIIDDQEKEVRPTCRPWLDKQGY